jgi:hypothetical protein
LDPIGVKTITGGNFNRYNYANDNPYRFLDPDGRYSCKGSSENCGDFEKAMTIARNAFKSDELTKDEQDNLKAVTDFIGTPDDGNKVIVTFNTDGLKGGSTGYNKSDGTTTLALRADKNLNNLGKNAVHEGKHGLTDSLRGRTDNNRNERLENEVGAYTTQGFYQKAIKYSGSANDPWVYGRGIVDGNVLNSAERSVQGACQGYTGGSCGG